MLRRALGVFLASCLLVSGLEALPIVDFVDVAEAVTPGQTSRMSVDSSAGQSNGPSAWPHATADGRYVVFHSGASSLVAGDTNGVADVFVRDRLTGLTTRVSNDSSSVQGNGASEFSSISADGRFIAFVSSATNLVAGDTNNRQDIFVKDGLTGLTTRVSVATSGAEANESSHGPWISGNGRFVVFHSAASNLISGDSNVQTDVFVRDLAEGTTVRVSVSSSGAEADGSSITAVGAPTVSTDGKRIVFYSGATNLVSGDTNAKNDVFVRDLTAGTTSRVSVSSSGVEGNNFSDQASISANGSFVAFKSSASNLVASDTNAADDIFRRDLATGTTLRASVDSASAQANAGSLSTALSGDGKYVVFRSNASNLVAGDTNAAADIFLRDIPGAATSRISIDSAGAQGNAASLVATISSQGRYIVFDSLASNLVATDTNGWADVFMHDRSPDAPQLAVSLNRDG